MVEGREREQEGRKEERMKEGGNREEWRTIVVTYW